MQGWCSIYGQPVTDPYTAVNVEIFWEVYGILVRFVEKMNNFIIVKKLGKNYRQHLEFMVANFQKINQILWIYGFSDWKFALPVKDLIFAPQFDPKTQQNRRK